MKQITVFHFSGTGNTKYISDHLVAGMEELSWKAESVSIVGLAMGERDKLIDKTDVLVLAYPIYGSDMPENMRRFIMDLPEGRGKMVGVLCTQMLFSGDGGSILFRTLRKKGYRQRWSYQINMPNNLCIKGSPFSQSSDYEIHEKKHLFKARVKIEKMALRIHSGKPRVWDHSPLHLLLGLSQRPAFRHFARGSYQKALEVDLDTCIGCGKCVRSCPEAVLTMNEHKARFDHRDRCLSCLRCLNFCPELAISFNNKVKEPLYKGPTEELYRELFN